MCEDLARILAMALSDSVSSAAADPGEVRTYGAGITAAGQ
jgi:hypothetical protein